MNDRIHQLTERITALKVELDAAITKDELRLHDRIERATNDHIHQLAEQIAALKVELDAAITEGGSQLKDTQIESKRKEHALYYFGTHHDEHGQPHELYEFVRPGSHAAQAADISQIAKNSSAQISISSAAPQKKGATPSSWLLPAFSIASRPFKWLWSVVMRLTTIFIVFIFIYELIILVPILNKPNAIKTELNNQAQSARLLLGLGKNALVGGLQAARDAADAGAPPPPEKQGKSPK